MLRRIFGAKRLNYRRMEKVTYGNTELYALYSSTDIIRDLKIETVEMCRTCRMYEAIQ